MAALNERIKSVCSKVARPSADIGESRIFTLISSVYPEVDALNYKHYSSEEREIAHVNADKVLQELKTLEAKRAAVDEVKSKKR